MKVFLISISPLDVFLWTVRRNTKDVVNLYNKLSPIMQLATGGSMLNFGLWNDNVDDPLSAQKNMCLHFFQLSELNSADLVADIGSGLSKPAELWQKENPNLNIFCVNTNFNQLHSTKNTSLDKINSTAINLPFQTGSLDRVVALESAQHFKPIETFFKETKRVLTKSGILTMAIPVTLGDAIRKLGILNFTWSSEHYSAEHIIDTLNHFGFKIITNNFVGSEIYDPLADYYVKNRENIKKNILKQYPSLVESILFKSIQKMKKASQNHIIDYMIIKCKI